MEYYTPFDIFPKSQFSNYENYVSYVSDLPKPIRSILVGSVGADFIRSNLQPTFTLNDEQVLHISEIIRDILLGTLFIGDLVSAISKEVGIDQQKAKNISDIIVGQLFAPAIQDIKNLQKKYFSDRLGSGGGAPSTPAPFSQSSQTINLRSQAPTSPKPAPIDPIIASLKTQSTPRPTPPSSQQISPQPQQNRPPQPSGQPQPNPQKTQNVFKIPDIDFGSGQTQGQPKQDGPKNVLDLRDQN